MVYYEFRLNNENLKRPGFFDAGTFLCLKYLHRILNGCNSYQPVILRSHRAVIDVNTVFVFSLIVIAFYRARFADGLAIRDKQVLVIVTALLQ